MEKRITAQGPKDRKSFTVTLPIEWAKRHRVDRSRKVEMDMVGEKIILSPRRDAPDRVQVKAGEFRDSLMKVLPGLYRRGVSQIKVEFDDPRLLEKITGILSDRLIGYEIVEQGRSSIMIQDITRESEDDFRTILRRIFLLVLEMSRADSPDLARPLERNIRRFVNYAQRILMKRGHADFMRTPLYYLMLDQLEKITDEYDWLLGAKTVSSETKKRLKELEGSLRQAYEVFYTFDPARFDRQTQATFILKEEIKLADRIDRSTMHAHNLARMVNSLYGTVFSLGFGGKDREGR